MAQKSKTTEQILHIRVPKALVQDVDSVARREERKRPNMIRILLKRGIDASIGEPK